MLETAFTANQGLFYETAAIIENTKLVAMILMCIYGAVALALYCVFSVGLYRLAAARKQPFLALAWVPVVRLFVFGSLLDRVRAHKGKKRVLRYVLLVLGAVSALLGILVGMRIADSLSIALSSFNFEPLLALFTSGAAVLFAFLAALAAYLVAFYYALFHYFRKFNAKSWVLYFVLSLVLPVAAPVFFFLCSEQGAEYFRKRNG